MSYLIMMSCIACSVLSNWFPMVDGERVSFGEYEPEYWLGVSVLPEHSTHISVFQNNELLFQHTVGTTAHAYYVTDSVPVLFYENEQLVGALVPEPNTMLLFLTGVVLLHRTSLYLRRLTC